MMSIASLCNLVLQSLIPLLPPSLFAYINNEANILVEEMFFSNDQTSLTELKIDVFFNIFLEVSIWDKISCYYYIINPFLDMILILELSHFYLFIKV